MSCAVILTRRARFPHTAFEDVAHAEAPPDLADVDVLAFEGERGIARDDEELRELRQRRDDVFRDAVGEIFLLRVAAHVGEGQHGDRGLAGQRRRAEAISALASIGVEGFGATASE